MIRRLVTAVLAVLVALSAQVAPVMAFWPVPNPRSHVSQWYSRRHPAIDIAAPRGSRVLAPLNGIVVFAGWRNNCGGWQVWIRDGARRHGLYTALYHFLRRPLVKVGQHVRGGVTQVGVIGRSGCTTGPHTHVEAWRGRPWAYGSYRINPWRYIRRHYQGA